MKTLTNNFVILPSTSPIAGILNIGKRQLLCNLQNANWQSFQNYDLEFPGSRVSSELATAFPKTRGMFFFNLSFHFQHFDISYEYITQHSIILRMYLSNNGKAEKEIKDEGT